MKDKIKTNPEFEKELKSKMDELASSVDCFDKISQRAFPSKNVESFDEDYCVWELENVTGKKKKHIRIVPFIAAAAAAVCILCIPARGSIMNFFYRNYENQDDQTFRDIINELNSELEKYDYEYQDYTLDEYIADDVLITPLQSCPFESKDKDNINVRIYTKMIGDYPTNQVYAIEYEGDYETGDYIAAADTKAKFTDTDIEKYANLEYSIGYVSNYLNLKNTQDVLTDNDNNPVTASEFSYESIYKMQDESYVLSAQIVYYHKNNDTENTEYYYDICGSFSETVSSYENLDESFVTDVWNNVVYYSGDSAEAKNELSNFHFADIYSSDYQNNDEIQINTAEQLQIFPFNVSDNLDASNTNISSIAITGETDENEIEIGNIIPPINQKLRTLWVVYASDIERNYNIKVVSDDMVSDFTLSYDYIIENQNQNIYNKMLEFESEQEVIEQEAKAKAASETEEYFQAQKEEAERMLELTLKNYQKAVAE